MLGRKGIRMSCGVHIVRSIYENPFMNQIPSGLASLEADSAALAISTKVRARLIHSLIVFPGTFDAIILSNTNLTILTSIFLSGPLSPDM